MLKLRGKGNVAKGALVPPSIDPKGLWDMDVNDDIWMDIGQEDLDKFTDGKPPPWLVDPKVRRAIPIAQELVNCHEELHRLAMECNSLSMY